MPPTSLRPPTPPRPSSLAPAARSVRVRGSVARALAVGTLAALAALTALAAACASVPFFGRGDAEFWGFAVPWDPRSPASASEHAEALDALVSGWIALDTLTGQPVAAPTGGGAPRASGPQSMAIVTTFVGSRFHPEVIRALANDDAALARAAHAIAEQAAAGGYRGLVLDFEGHTARDRNVLAKVVRAIGDSARARDLGPVAVAVPAADTSGYPARALLPGADLVLVMLYDEHWTGSPPGPIASPDWARRQLGVRVAEVGADRLVVSLPLFGYVWRPNAATQVVSFAEARGLAGTAGDFLEREPASETLRAARAGEWEVWVSDAELLRALIAEARGSNIRRFALWRLGLEDPAVWGVVSGD